MSLKCADVSSAKYDTHSAGILKLYDCWFVSVTGSYMSNKNATVLKSS